MAGIESKLSQLSTQSQAAQQALQTAQQNEQQALATQTDQEQRLTVVKAQAAHLQQQLGEWARNAYVTGGAMARLQAYIAALQADKTDDVGDALFLIGFVGESQAQALDQAQTLASVQQLIADQASTAAQQATAARVQAQAARDRVQAALSAQQALLLPEQGAAGRSAQPSGVHPGPTGPAERRPGDRRSRPAGRCGRRREHQLGQLWGWGHQEVRAGLRERSDPPLRSLPDLGCAQSVTPGGCRGGLRQDVQGLRRAVRPAHLCDRLLSLYSEQVALYASKPNLAAVPGTSNHGLGVAVDLCGGIESFGTVQHQWLFTHAPLFGWFHPLWAEPTGSRPEPWHWEFSG